MGWQKFKQTELLNQILDDNGIAEYSSDKDNYQVITPKNLQNLWQWRWQLTAKVSLYWLLLKDQEVGRHDSRWNIHSFAIVHANGNITETHTKVQLQQ
jgi:hypothetical protein